MRVKNFFKYFLLMVLVFFNTRIFSQSILVEQFQPTIPVLVDKDHNPVLRVVFKNADPSTSIASQRLFNIALDLSGTTDLNDIELVSIHEESKDRGALMSQYSHASSPLIAEKMSINMRPLLNNDSLVLWIAVRLKSKVNLLNKINVRVIDAYTDQGQIPVPAFEATGLRVGYALHKQMDFNIHTARIPGLATTKKGTLIAIWDARHHNDRDLQGDMDIVIRRSEDGGQSWGNPITVLDMGTFGGLHEKFNGVSDANILVDENTGKIFIIGLWMHGVLNPETGKNETWLDEFSPLWNHQWRSFGSQPGYEYHRTSQFIMTTSTDDGLTWSEPENLTKQVKKEEWWLLAPAPGAGITLRDGTLVFPTEGRDENGLQFSCITYSKDGGKTWKTSNPAYTNTNECMAVQLADGSIMLNMRERSNNGKVEGNGRAIAITHDLGETWVEHHTSRSALIEPACMASLYNHHEVLYFFNPNSTSQRDQLTLKVSFDQGNTWPEEYWTLLDQYRGSGYSCITKVDDEHIGIIYEGSQANMVFQVLPVAKKK